MKKIVTLLAIFIFINNEIYAGDTLRLCHALPPYPGFDAASLYDSYCPNALFLTNIIAIVNGDSVVEPAGLGVGFFPFGTEGIMDVYCDGIVDGNPDTTIYYIGSGMPQICVITSDSNNHAVIYVDSSTLYGNHVLQLQRQVNTVTWQTVLTFSPNDNLMLVDNTSNTRSQSYTYRLASLNCEGYQHTTTHLQSTGSNLSWNQYGGQLTPLRGYYIHRRRGLGSFTLIDSTSNLSYTDLNFQSGDEYYVGAYKDDGCQSNSWRAVGSPILVRSNTLQIGTSGITETEQTLKRYYVEGSTLYVELKKADDVSLYDITGRELIHRHTDNLDLQLQPGIYILNVGAKGYKVLIP